MSSAREQILSRVGAALAPLKERAAMPDWDSELIRLRTAQPPVDPVALFTERMTAVNGTVMHSLAALVAMLAENGWRRGYCDPAIWPRLQAAFADGFTVETSFDRTRVDEYDFGITAATGAIAETGTLILSDAGTSSRLGALAPWVHVAVLDPRTIHADIGAALAVLPKDPNVIWVTGPSKTADIEGILIEGVHGPGVQMALLLSV
ncbi:MAG TPA: LUD domain-containing protein [Opitutaceae bacterium]